MEPVTIDNNESTIVNEQASQNTKYSVKEMRQMFETSIEVSNNSSKDIYSEVTIAGMGEIGDTIAEAFAALHVKIDKSEETGWKARVRALIPWGVGEKVEQKMTESSIKSKNVGEVTKNLVNTLSKKRSTVENMIETLFRLHDKIENSYNDLQSLKEHLKLSLEEGAYEGRDEFHVKVLYADVLAYEETLGLNMKNAKSTIETATVSVQQIAGAIPKLEAQMNDGAAIAATLEHLNVLTTSVQAVEEMCNGVTTENTERIAAAQMRAIESYTVSEESIKRIANNNKRALTLEQNMISKRKEMSASLGRKIDTLSQYSEQRAEMLDKQNSADIETLKQLNGYSSKE